MITVQDGEYRVERDGFDVEWATGNIRQHGVEVPQGAQDVYTAADEAGVDPHEMAKIFAEREKEQKKEHDGKDGYTPMSGSETQDRRLWPGAPGQSNEIIHNLILTVF